ncbi:hypothetical protein F5B22DRAFT_101076 [Xylaria bambusicola]|uniref:uncharacterized protein n=1 Tax=Xylaria bambusicola TaxID=326684 RepID=UPI0020081DBB|nr:uncharacterized protein F5B22DRAFT_101076 [Xylaria bambusicola]KAI0517809.1 hypothetical protein F5B22DRAFT_101076 [Xylaria bambusicola]
MAPSTTARVRRTAQNTQYTYNIPRRIHTVHTYPVLSPQGATIIIYGHENGVTLVWRGGRRFKPEVQEAAAKGANGKQNGQPPQDAVMILDSDEEDAPEPETFVDKPQFEETLDDESTYPEITQTLDLEFDTAVMHISTLPLTPCLAEDASWEGTDILKEKIVFTASCSTREVFLVTLPLVPPSPLSKSRKGLQESLLAGKAGNGKWGETVTLLAGQQKPSDGLAMTLIRPRPTRSKSSERSRSTNRALHRVVVAAHCREAAGALRLWDVPLEVAAKPSQQIEPFQTEYLPKPLTSISFNATHSTQLLCNASPNAVRIYDYNMASMPPDDISEGPFPSQGSWLISLYPPFVRQSTSRKPILAASWIARGRAIFVLLADGEWGIWDIDGVSPQGSAHFGKPGSGIVGDAITEFNISGYVEGTSPLRNPGTQRTSGSTSEFVPMTPHSRRDAFSNTSGPERLATVSGGVVVTPLPSSTTTTADENVTLWIGSLDHVFTIPGLFKFWDAQIRKSAGGGVNLFSGAQPTRMIRLNDLSVGLMGERCTQVGAIVRFAETGGMSAPGNEGLPVDVVVCGESRLVIIRESEAAVGTRIGGVISRRKRLSDRARDTSAIIVHPRPEQPSSIAYNLSLGPRRRLSRPISLSKYDETAGDDMMAADKEKSPVQTPSKPPSGFDFAAYLSAAADQEQQDGDEERDVEIEMLDIMEIDRELDAMDGGRGRGRKKVMFDS